MYNICEKGKAKPDITRLYCGSVYRLYKYT